MMAKSPHTIKSFFEPTPSCSQSPRKGDARILPTIPPSIADDFTESELRRLETLSPGPDHWMPQQNYEDVSIGELAPGPRRVSFTARVVNLHDQSVNSEMQTSGKGCLKILVKDDGALILINLWYAKMVYQVRLGDLLTVWTTHISSTSTNGASMESSQAATLVTSVFPERDAGCRIRTADQPRLNRSICNTPLGYVSGRPLFGLMSLKAFIEEGGDEVLNAKILVCVKAVGSISTFTSKQGQPVTTLSVGICDEISEATLSIYGSLIPSAGAWEQYETILLISSPVKRPGRKLNIKARTLVEIDPDIGEAEWLRRWMQRENCAINENFPADLFDIERIIQAPMRLQFTLASLDGFIRGSPSQIYTGYLSVILTRLNLVLLWTRRQLFSMECCGTPIYANTSSNRCEQCGTYDVDLRINPNLVAELADETGGVSWVSGADGTNAENSFKAVSTTKRQHSKVLWTDEAWTQLLGRSPEQLAGLVGTGDPAQAQHNLVLLRYLEQRLMFMRVILLVGWTGDNLGGRLAVLSVVG